MSNQITLTDSYKLSHDPQYKPDSTGFWSMGLARGGAFQETTFFGLQMHLMRDFMTPIKQADIDRESWRLKAHMGGMDINKAGWEHILRDHGGYLPMKIRAVPEGTTVPVGNILFSIETICPQCRWVGQTAETLLSHVWYTTAVATLSREWKKMYRGWLLTTGSPMHMLDFALHDFGFRGVTCKEQAGIGGLAHLIHFKGTDTMIALDYAEEYYLQPEHDIAGFSIPAAEHSTITSWGRDGEADAVENILNRFPTGPVSIIGDTYDIYNFCANVIGGKHRERILARDGVVVVRPDSGTPFKVMPKVLNILGEKFGAVNTRTGHRLLNSKVRTIWGDGIDLEGGDLTLGTMARTGWAAANTVFGSGGGLLQKLNRDTIKFKIAAADRTDTEGRHWPMSKSPVDAPDKKSIAGRQKLIKHPDFGYQTVQEYEPGQDLLEDVWTAGWFHRIQSLTQIREIANGNL